MNKMLLGELLIKNNCITEHQLDKALVDIRHSKTKLGQHLVAKGVIKEQVITRLLSDQLEVPRFFLSKDRMDMETARLIPSAMARKLESIPLTMNGPYLQTLMIDPTNVNAIEKIERETNIEVDPVICTRQEFEVVFDHVYGQHEAIQLMVDGLDGSSATTMASCRPDHILLSEASEMSLQEHLPPAQEIEVPSLKCFVFKTDQQETKKTGAHDSHGAHGASAQKPAAIIDDAPVIKFIDIVLREAIQRNVSDIHFDPSKDKLRIRFRVDGKMLEIPSPPHAMQSEIISRLKIMSYLDISVARIPQDGRFTIKVDNTELNVRVSTMPTIHGESVVLRILDTCVKKTGITDIGLCPRDKAVIEKAIHLPYGLYVSTGPTGSGKSTTLFTLLQEINTPDINIVTLEDPVEYRIDGVRQIQLNTQIGMNFASGLRSILRQDPDVIMVGEIRDSETANIAVQAALTGHRVFSTLHTNDAAGAVTRLIHMGVAPFLVAAVLRIVNSQRLVRTICPECRTPVIPSAEEIRFLAPHGDDLRQVWRGTGCLNCNFTGYKGRIGLFEVLSIDAEIQDLILECQCTAKINEYCLSRGKLRSLKSDAVDKIRQGVTTIEEAVAATMA